jgi:hypothetical protein
MDEANKKGNEPEKCYSDLAKGGNLKCGKYPVSLILSGVLWRARSDLGANYEDKLIALVLLGVRLTFNPVTPPKTFAFIVFRDCVLMAAPDDTMYNALQTAFIEAGLGPDAVYEKRQDGTFDVTDDNQSPAVDSKQRELSYDRCTAFIANEKAKANKAQADKDQAAKDQAEAEAQAAKAKAKAEDKDEPDKDEPDKADEAPVQDQDELPVQSPRKEKIEEYD